MLDWNDLQLVSALAQNATLSAAARALEVDQSTVSRRLAALERRANARLFERTPTGYALSAIGEVVLEQVLQMEQHAVAVERKLVGHDSRPAGKVRLATSDSFAAWFLTPLLAEFAQRQPDIEIELVTGDAPVSLPRREADLSLRLSKPTEANLIARRLGRAAWAVYASEQYLLENGTPRSARALRRHRVVALGAELSRTIGAKWLGEQAHGGHTSITVNSLIAQAAAVVAGFGLGPLPCVYGDAQGELRRLPFGVIGHHEVWMVVHPDVRASARVREVMAFLVENIRAAAPLLEGRGGASER